MLDDGLMSTFELGFHTEAMIEGTLDSNVLLVSKDPETPGLF